MVIRFNIILTQSRSQSMPVRGLCSGMTLGKSNRNRYLIGCRDHQCCRYINACFLRELRVDMREERIINVYQIWNAKSNNIFEGYNNINRLNKYWDVGYILTKWHSIYE